MAAPPREYSFNRYLQAKKELDDRSLNRHVREVLAVSLAGKPRASPARVLEVGCGLGAMLGRLLDWRLLGDFAYTGIDLEPSCITAARSRWRQAGLSVPAEFEAIDLFSFLQREQGQRHWDLLMAHAFLDLVDLEATLPGLLGLLAPEGFFYFTLNFDGVTCFEPVIDPGLDRLIETLYHEDMDRRRVNGRPAGSSRTGRQLLSRLQAAGATVLAAGSSDWVVFPGPQGYSGDEAYFLHFIIDTVRQALEGHPELPAAAFKAWIEARHAQIQRQTLCYLAHQLDFCGRV